MEPFNETAVYGEWQRLLLGPLADLLDDPAVTELVVNGPNHVFVERAGRLERVAGRFPGGAWQLDALARNLAESVGRPLDPARPILDARTARGDRVHIVAPPCAPGVHLNIRPVRRISARLADLVAWGALPQPAADALARAVADRRNLVVAGATGAGKTTVLSALAAEVPATERVVVIEDTTELRLDHGHVVPMEARPAGAVGDAVRIRDLFVAALRMRPDRLMIGEVRKGEALDVVQAMLSGHSGVMTTVHADGPRAALLRLGTLCLMADVPIPEAAARRMLAAAVQVIVSVARTADGRRRVTQITEVSPGRRGFRLTPVYAADGH